VFELRAPMMVKNHYEPAAMKISTWQKGMDVIGGYARAIGVPTPMFDAGAAIYKKARKSGRDDEDAAAVCAVLEKTSGVKQGRSVNKKR
jgi:L-threonate 2-dehydrogenase